MQIPYELTPDSTVALARVVDAANAIAKRAERKQWLLRWFNAGGLLFLFVMIGITERDAIERWLNPWLSFRELEVGASVCAAWIVGWFAKGLYDRRNVPSVAGALVESMHAGGFYGPATFECDEAGVKQTGQGFEIRAGWSQIQNIDTDSSPDYIFITTRLGWTITVPRSAFPDEAAESTLKNALDRLRQTQLVSSAPDGADSIEFEQTIDDLAALRRYYLRRGRGKYARVLGMIFASLPVLIVGGMLTFALVVVYLRPVPFREAVPILTVLSVVTLLFAGVPVYVAWCESPSGSRRFASRNIRRGRMGRFVLSRKRITIGTGGLRVSWKGSDHFLRWRDICCIVAYADHIFLLITHSSTDVRGFIIPMSAFPNEAAAIQFCSRAESYWQAAKSPGTRAA